MIIQKERTLDDLLLSVLETFPNGCNYRLIMDEFEWLEMGCYGVHINLVHGDAKFLWDWFRDGQYQVKDGYRRKLSSLVSPETIVELLKREPCRVCGGTRFKDMKAQPEN